MKTKKGLKVKPVKKEAITIINYVILATEAKKESKYTIINYNDFTGAKQMNMYHDLKDGITVKIYTKDEKVIKYVKEEMHYFREANKKVSFNVIGDSIYKNYYYVITLEV